MAGRGNVDYLNAHTIRRRRHSDQDESCMFGTASPSTWALSQKKSTQMTFPPYPLAVVVEASERW